MSEPFFARPRPRFAAAISGHPVAAAATGEVIGQVLDANIAEPDAAIVVMSGTHCEFASEIVATIHATIRPKALIGAAASGLLGPHREMPDLAGIALWISTQQGVQAFVLDDVSSAGIDDHGDISAGFVNGWPAAADAGASAFVFGDAASFPATQFLATAPRTLRVVGGTVAAQNPAGRGVLLAGRELRSRGAVGLVFPPTIRAATLVSQGCRPVGSPFVVTAADGPSILELGSRPAFDRFEEIVASLAPEDRSALRRRIHLGVVLNEQVETPGPGDFLIRTIVGADRRRAALVVDRSVPVGATVQLHVSDATGASEELDAVLRRTADGPCASSIVCAGESRGEHFFGQPDHDAERFQDWTNGPWIGAFCQQVFGPVGHETASSTLGVSALQFP